MYIYCAFFEKHLIKCALAFLTGCFTSSGTLHMRVFYKYSRIWTSEIRMPPYSGHLLWSHVLYLHVN